MLKGKSLLKRKRKIPDENEENIIDYSLLNKRHKSNKISNKSH